MNKTWLDFTELDGAEILEYAILDDTVQRTGKTRHIVLGVEQDNFHGLAICRYSKDNGYYLFYCDDCWNVISDTYANTIEDAKNQADFEYVGLKNRWIKK